MIKSRIAKKINCTDCSINHLCIGSDVAPTDLDLLNNVIKNIKYVAKKDHVYRMNAPVLNLYAIYQGSCKEYWIDESGNECVTNFYFPGDIIGIESVSKQNYMFYTQTLEDCELCVIPVKEFLELMTQAPNILKRFITITNQKMRHDQTTCAGVTTNEKVCDFLLDIAMRMYERNPHEKEIVLTMSQVDIANFLGITAETINRIFNTLKKNKIIKLKNKTLEVLDIPELQKLGKLDYTVLMN